MTQGLSDRRGALTWALAATFVITTLIVAIRWGAFIAGGSDSYCYVGQAAMWVDGTLWRPMDPGFHPTWANATLSLAPAGFVPSSVIPGGVAPICPPGLGFLMAIAAFVAGPHAVFAVVPFTGAIAVLCVFRLGHRLAGHAAGVVAATLLLASPVFLHQLLQPMSDVPAAALWLAALVLAGRPAPALAGLCGGIAVLIRPTLAPLAIPLALLASRTSAGGHRRLARLAAFAGGMVPGGLTTIGLNALLYGSPLGSGYGDPAHLFATANITRNAARYGEWLLATQSPWILLGIAAPWVLRRDRTSWQLSVAGLSILAILLAVYLPYVVFDSWSYLRFLLPGVAVLLACSGAVLDRWSERLPRIGRTVLMAGVCVAVAGFTLREARARGVFDLRAFEGRFAETGAWVRAHLPENAVILTVWHSGSTRYHGARMSVLWDAIEPDALDDVMASLATQGRAAYLLLEAWEEPVFRQRFAGRTPVGRLDWPPRAQIGREIRIYDPAARARHFRGDPVASERVWTEAERRRFAER
jgi:hypothetical protein